MVGSPYEYWSPYHQSLLSADGRPMAGPSTGAWAAPSLPYHSPGTAWFMLANTSCTVPSMASHPSGMTSKSSVQYQTHEPSHAIDLDLSQPINDKNTSPSGGFEGDIGERVDDGQDVVGCMADERNRHVQVADGQGADVSTADEQGADPRVNDSHDGWSMSVAKLKKLVEDPRSIVSKMATTLLSNMGWPIEWNMKSENQDW
jgi:hypothetical protein